MGGGKFLVRKQVKQMGKGGPLVMNNHLTQKSTNITKNPELGMLVSHLTHIAFDLQVNGELIPRF